MRIQEALLERLKEEENLIFETIEFQSHSFLKIHFSGLDGTLYVTLGLSDHTMKIPEKYKGESNVELYFFTPIHWETAEKNGALITWALQTLVKAKTYVMAGNWVLTGQTFDLTEVPEGKFKELNFVAMMLVPPHEAKFLSEPIVLENNQVSFRALVPVFKDEKEYKIARGFKKLWEKFHEKRTSEKLDEFRLPVVKNRILFWR
ncbi:MAG: suppressor of fused domain protein [Flavobacteriia bacterium]